MKVIESLRQMTGQARTASAERPQPRTNPLDWLAVYAAIFASIFILHLPLLHLPYYWDEAGFFIPAARDILLMGDPVPQSTASTGHPPLVMAYIALWWQIFGESIVVTRTAMLAVAAFALLAVFRLAQHVANREVAIATTICTAVYPVFFSQSSMAHLDMAAAVFTILGLLLYLPPREERIQSRTVTLERPGLRRAACIALLALAALAKETAIFAPLGLLGWELLCRFSGRIRKRSPAFCLETRGLGWSLLLLVALLPVGLWFAYHHQRTGYVFGNPDVFRYSVEATLTPARIILAARERFWHLTRHMNLYFLTIPAVLSLILRPMRDHEEERRRISVPVQLAIAVVILAYASALSMVGGAILARYLLPVLPLVILICVSIIWRRTRHWRKIIGLVCAGFTLGILSNPSYSHTWEDNLAYRDFVILHRNAARFLADEHPDARVLTTWPATDNLKHVRYGYTPRPLHVVAIADFTAAQLERAEQRRHQFDVVLLFSTHIGLSLEEAHAILGGHIVYREERRGQWIAILKTDAR